METSTPTFDQLPHVVGGLSEKLDRVLELLEKAGFTGHSKQSKPSRIISKAPLHMAHTSVITCFFIHVLLILSAHFIGELRSSNTFLIPLQ